MGHESEPTQWIDPNDDEDYCDSGSGALSLSDLPDLYDELLDLVPSRLRSEFGEVFYSGRSAFQQPAKVYILGFNPGGDPGDSTLNEYTIGADIERSRSAERSDWSALDDDWSMWTLGSRNFQSRVLYLLEKCGLGEAKRVPMSNVVFVRSIEVDALEPERKRELLRDCWAVHEKVIAELDIKVVVCMGAPAGEWVQKQLGAYTELNTYRARNGQHWTSTTHQGRDDIQVVRLAHPSRANWTNPESNPTHLVSDALAWAGRGEMTRHADPNRDDR